MTSILHTITTCLRRHSRRHTTRAQQRNSTIEILEARIAPAYTFTGGGTNTGTATGDGNADTLYLEPFGGLIYHSTDGTVFSPDWGGGLTIAASAANTIKIHQGNPANAHTVILGGVLGAESTLHAAMHVFDGGANDTLTVDESLNGSAQTFTYSGASGALTGTGINVQRDTPVAHLNLIGTPNADRFTVNATASAGELINIDGGNPLTSPGDTLSVNAGDLLIPTDSNSGTISQNGVQKLTFSHVEAVTFSGVMQINGDQDSANESDTFTVTTNASGAFSAILNGHPLVVATAAALNLNGLGGNDTFQLDGINGAISIRGGPGEDRVDFSSATQGVVFNLDAVGVDQRITSSDATVTLLDRVEDFTGSTHNDILHVTAAMFPRSIDGGLPDTASGDTVIFDGQGAVVTVQKTFNSGTIHTKGYGDTTYNEFETVQLTNTPSGPGGFGNPGSNSNAFATADIYDLTHFNSGGKPAPGKAPSAVATGDLNGDGFADIVTANSKSGNLSILINKGDQTFFDPVNVSTGKAAPRDIVIGDFDGDMKLDVVVSNPSAGSISFFKGDGAGNLAAPVTTLTPKFKPYALAFGTMDAAIGVDLVATSRATSAIEVLHGNNDGTFTPGTPIKMKGKLPNDIVVADINGDGNLDVATANSGSNNVSFFAGDGNGMIGPEGRFATGTMPTGLAAADLNNDGKLDLAVSNFSSRFISVLIGQGLVPAATQFAPQLRVTVPGLRGSASIVIGDFDGNGIADIGLGNSLNSNFTILLGIAPTTYTQPYDFDLGRTPHAVATGGIAIADFNNDGLPDIVATGLQANDVSVLLRNV